VRLPRQLGIGPFGILGSALLLAAAFWLKDYVPLSPIFSSPTIPRLCLLFGIVLSALVAIWSVRSLPIDKRGTGVCTTGAYRYVRHPVYAAFTSIGALGLALYFNHTVFLVWLLAVQAWWHWLIPIEERSMIEEFGDEYEQYMQRTGRFIPRFVRHDTA
jgi:protein-S-isoprenylcysteine O-methyltransferase Ste14